MVPNYTFIYDPANGHPVADGKVKELLDSLPQDPLSGTVIFTSTMLVIDAVRLRIARGELDHMEVMIRFEGQNYPLNEFGNNRDLPREFDKYSDYSSDILRAQSKKHQAARAQ